MHKQNRIMDRSPLDLLKQSKGIIICSLNIRSIFKNLDEVSVILSKGDIDILLLQETFLTSYISDDMIQIEGYNIWRSDRDAGSGKRGGGGLMVYYKKRLNISHLSMPMSQPQGHPQDIHMQHVLPTRWKPQKRNRFD